MIEDKRRSRKLRNRGTGMAPRSSSALAASDTPAKPDRPRRPKLSLKLPVDVPPGNV